MTDVLGSSFSQNASERIRHMKTIVQEDDASLIIYYIGNTEENLLKKRASIFIGFSLIAIGLLLLYKKIIIFFYGYVKSPLYETGKFETSPPPYHLFAPPTFEESVLMEDSRGKKKLEDQESSAMVHQPSRAKLTRQNR